MAIGSGQCIDDDQQHGEYCIEPKVRANCANALHSAQYSEESCEKIEQEVPEAA